MLIVGEWQVGDDGTTRPVVRATVLGLDGNPVAEDFLVDSGADRTVLSAAVLERLHLPVRRGQSSLALSGIGGESAFVLVNTVIVMIRDDGGAVRIRGEVAGFICESLISCGGQVIVLWRASDTDSPREW